MSNGLIKIILPVFLVILGAMGIAINYTHDNMPAVSGYFSATCAWIIVAGFNIVDYIRKREYGV
jgi:hypothetical protein